MRFHTQENDLIDADHLTVSVVVGAQPWEFDEALASAHAQQVLGQRRQASAFLLDLLGTARC